MIRWTIHYLVIIKKKKNFAGAQFCLFPHVTQSTLGRLHTWQHSEFIFMHHSKRNGHHSGDCSKKELLSKACTVSGMPKEIFSRSCGEQHKKKSF